MSSRRDFLRVAGAAAGASSGGHSHADGAGPGHQTAGVDRRQAHQGDRRARALRDPEVTDIVKGTPFATPAGGGGNNILGPHG